MAMSDTLKSKAGPLPVWAWAGIGTAGLAGYLYYRNKKQAAAAAAAAAQQPSDSSNLGTTPVSNLTTEGQPMPIQMGDTFVNVTQPPDSDNPAPPKPPPPKPPPVKKPPPPTGTKPPTPKPPPPPTVKPKTVTVCAFPGWCGSLSGIAKQEYGNGNLWPIIYNANKALIGANPNLIHPGQVLTIPPKPANA